MTIQRLLPSMLLAWVPVYGLFQGSVHAEIKILADFKCAAAIQGTLTEVDFENLPHGTSSCPALEVAGVTFTDPSCVRIGFCSSPTCSPDPDNAIGGEGNNVLSLHAGGAIDFPPGTKSVVLEIQGIGSNLFTLRITNPAGDVVESTGKGIFFGVVFHAFTSRSGISRIEVQSVGGTGGPIAISRLFLGPKEIKLPLSPCEDENAPKLDNLRPTDAGTIRFIPGFGILDRAPVASDVQSTYFRTTEENREFRRGFIEFAIPRIDDRIVKATLFLGDSMGTVAGPRPPDVHELSFYPADLEVNVEDFDAPTTFLARFETHPDLSEEVFSFDISELIRRFHGNNLGFRVKLESDPDLHDFGSFGCSFGSLAHTFPRIEIETEINFNAFIRGDPNGDERIDVSDTIATLNFLFLGELGRVRCEKSADIDDSGTLDITDSILGLIHLFLGGLPPEQPFPGCGLDATDDSLTCVISPPCG